MPPGIGYGKKVKVDPKSKLGKNIKKDRVKIKQTTQDRLDEAEGRKKGKMKFKVVKKSETAQEKSKRLREKANELKTKAVEARERSDDIQSAKKDVTDAKKILDKMMGFSDAEYAQHKFGPGNMGYDSYKIKYGKPELVSGGTMSKREVKLARLDSIDFYEGTIKYRQDILNKKLKK